MNLTPEILAAERREQCRLIEERDAAVDACRALMLLIGNGTLVRDMSKDSEACFALRQLSLVRALKWAQNVIDKDDARKGIKE